MKFALVDGQRTIAAPGLTGFCPACDGEMVAKCGSVRVHHWAHRGERHCDSWWEPETAWHRNWKNEFPVQWQEIRKVDEFGEKHIADVHTDKGLTVEFQHSHLRPEERIAREKFYGNMIWVVDGSRLVRDFPRFLDGMRSRVRLRRGLYIIPRPETVFSRSWLDCGSPVFFDYQNALGHNDARKTDRSSMWCLLPGRALEFGVVIRLSREKFVRLFQERRQPIQAQAILEEVMRTLLLLANQAERRVAKSRNVQHAMQPSFRPYWRRSTLPRF